MTAAVTVAKLADGTFTFGDGTNGLAFANIEVLVGGTGANTLDFSASEEAVVVNLAGGESTDFPELSGFSNVTGSAFGDTIIGNERANVLTGGSGDDVISGGPGADTIDGGPGGDRLYEWRDASFTLTNTTLTTTPAGGGSAEVDTIAGIEWAELNGGAHGNTIDARAFDTIQPTTPLSILNGGAGVPLDANDLVIHLTNNTTVSVDLVGATSIQDVLDAINAASPYLVASIRTEGNALQIVDSVGGPYALHATSASALAADLGIAGVGAGATLSGSPLSGGSVTLDGGSTVRLEDLNSGTGVRRTDGDQVNIDGTTLLSVLNQGGGVRRVDGPTSGSC